MRVAPTLVRMPVVAGVPEPRVACGMTGPRFAPGVLANFHEFAIARLASHRRPK